MVRREHFVNKLRALDYTFKDERKRVRIWRKRGGTHYISVPKCDLLEETYVHSTLRQAGCQEAEIQAFIKSANG